MPKIALYIRVSTRDQQSGHGIKCQHNVNMKYCQSQGWIKGRIYKEVHNGTSLKRPKLRALLKAVKESEVDTIVVYNMDRLSRNKEDLAKILHSIDSYGARVISVNQNLDTGSPESIKKALFAMLGATSEIEHRFSRGG
jgi:site-specific DNA recombinase